MFLRFVTAELHWLSGRKTGVFHAAAQSLFGDELSEFDRARLSASLAWFAVHLPQPDRLTVSRRPGAKELAISWFRDNAVEHLARAREMAEILTANRLLVEILKTRRPGYVVYEDAFQVVAYPFGDTPC